VKAVYDPLSKKNNFFGIHILFLEEAEKASKFVNSNGGDWGYVTVPIQAGDRDIEKWQKFMDDARDLHIIPIVRLATEPYYKNTSVWRKPNEYDIIDFANFLNSLSWPVKNKYILVFNEVNRFDEWGGEVPNPNEYLHILNFTTDTFKRRSDDFFIIMAGLDNAAPSDGLRYMQEFEYLNKLAEINPEVFNKIDGFASHSYPNPGFSQPPSLSKMGVSTYRYEYEFINKFTQNKKPVFITEAGWSSDSISESDVSSYYKYTFENIWGKDKDKIVAITPFLLESQDGQFDKFSFYKRGSKTEYLKTLESLPKIKGEPITNVVKTPKKIPDKSVLGVKNFNQDLDQEDVYGEITSDFIRLYFKTIFGLNY